MEKEKMSMAKFIQYSMKEEFRDKYYIDLDKLKKDYDISNDVFVELKTIDLIELGKTIQHAGWDFGIGDLAAVHTQNDHTSHNQGDHSQDSHDDDRASIGNQHIWRELVERYADNVSKKMLINLGKLK